MQFSKILSILLVPLATCTHLRISIPPSPIIPNPSSLPPTTSASLTTISHNHHALLRVDNTFDFRNVTSGSYLLDIHCHTHVFAPLRVDVHEVQKPHGGEVKEIAEVEVWGTFRGNEWANKGEAISVYETEVGSKIWAFEVKAVTEKAYLVERPGFSPLSLLKNPMILIAGVSMLIVFGMPYLMENMDPEMRAEFEQRQKTSPLTGGPPAANPLQNFDAAAWLAGSSGNSGKKSDVPTEKGITR